MAMKMDVLGEIQRQVEEGPEQAAEPRPVETSFNEFRKVVESRRSVCKYDGTPVPEVVVQQCLDLALLAPNSSNLQAWEFHWVRSPEVKRELVKACMSQPAAATAAELIVCVARTDTWRRNAREMVRRFEAASPAAPKAARDYYAKLVPWFYEQGPFSVFGALRRLVFWVTGWVRPIPREPMSHAGMRLWAEKTSALACENLMLGFRAAGFDSCPMEGFDSRRVKRLLGLPSRASITMVISAGKRAPEGVYGPRVRFDRDWFVKIR